MSIDAAADIDADAGVDADADAAVTPSIPVTRVSMEVEGVIN